MNFCSNRQTDRTTVNSRHDRTGTSQGAGRWKQKRLATGTNRQQITDSRHSEAISSQHGDLRRGGARFSREDQGKSLKIRRREHQDEQFKSRRSRQVTQDSKARRPRQEDQDKSLKTRRREDQDKSRQPLSSSRQAARVKPDQVYD